MSSRIKKEDKGERSLVAFSSPPAPWLSPIIKKRKSTKLKPVKREPPLVSPIMDWLKPPSDKSSIRYGRMILKTRSFKSTVTDYHNDPRNPAPGDLVMATAEQMSHPAYTMKESIGAAYLLFGKVRFFTYKSSKEGVKELLSVDWCFLQGDPRTYDVPAILPSKATLLSKRNSYDLEDLNDFIREAVDVHWELDRVSGWEKLI